jgi:hypothetical protein
MSEFDTGIDNVGNWTELIKAREMTQLGRNFAQFLQM